MTDEQILKLAISKAVKNGWKGFTDRTGRPTFHQITDTEEIKDDGWGTGHFEVMVSGNRNFVNSGWVVHQNRIIYDHDFAKAFFGTEHDFLATGTWNQECRNCHRTKTSGEVLRYSCWEYGLLGMVLEENPLEYLEQFLGG